jgi:pimeloyl-ACP methyl ester carboxylesterase
MAWMREAAVSDHHTRPDDRAGLATSARRRSMPPSPGAVCTGIVLVCLAAVMPAVPRVMSTAAAGARAAASLPTIVLVHGAWADGSGWEGVVRRLQSDGYPVVVPANPLRGLPGDSAYVAGVLRSVAGPVILVGHSYGGAVITNAALGDPAVKALVYVDAFVPDAEGFAGPNAHTVAVDPATHRIFLPLADDNGRPVLRVMAPGST